MENPKIILTEDEFIDYAEGTKLLYFSFIDSAQFVFRNISEKYISRHYLNHLLKKIQIMKV